jgi:hypothetical protein
MDTFVRKEQCFMSKLNKQRFNELGQKVAGVAQSGLDRSKRLAEIAKLRASNHAEESAMKRAYMEIGKLYYAERGDAPEGAYVALCSRISKSQDTITHNLNQIAELKSVDDITEEDFEDDVQIDVEEEAPEEPQEEVPEAQEEEEPVAVSAEEESAAEETPIPDEE